MDRFLFDARLTVRALLRSKMLAFSAVVAMALGIGATTTLFSIVRGATRDLPFRDAHELVVVHPRSRAPASTHAFDYLHWSEQQQSFDALAAFRTEAVSLAAPGSDPERASAAFVTSGTFQLLDAAPQRGRALHAHDENPAADAVALISDRLWRARYSGDPAIIGRTIRINGAPHTVIGVMPHGFG